MSNYNWEKYNIKNMKLAKRFISLNKKNKFNFIEKGLYNHVRDILCLSLLINKKKKLNVLDYGSNILSLININKKIDINLFNFFIYDPFLKEKKNIKHPFKISILNKKKDLQKKHFDVVNFGSSIQYIKNLKDIEETINFLKVSSVVITHTPLTLKKEFISKQTNHKQLSQKIYNYYNIINFFKKKKFKLIFKSRNKNKYVASLKNKSSTFSLNLVFNK
tara:strand:+ start:316 stop:972 length:657 start_codon:yes stop_codon:yes gene_type:complete